jgi:hypothetical protein
VLEWRLDPSSSWRIPEASGPDREVVVCRRGYSSSLAAVSPRAVGLHCATESRCRTGAEVSARQRAEQHRRATGLDRLQRPQLEQRGLLGTSRAGFASARVAATSERGRPIAA